MKTLLALIASLLVATASTADYAIYEIDAANPMFIVEILADMCNEDLNLLPGVSCTMSIEHWSMDLILPAGNIQLMELEQITVLFCKVGDVVGTEPKITVNGWPRPCGGIEV
jgi:hypothetical protein